MTTPATHDVRQRAWKTRRAKYGQRGHSGAYDCGRGQNGLVRRLRLVLARLHVEGVLSEGQFAKMAEISRVDARILADEVQP